jgi:hypothetical protein
MDPNASVFDARKDRVGQHVAAHVRLGRVARNQNRACRSALQILGEREHHEGNALSIRALAKKLISDATVALVQGERRNPLVDIALGTLSAFGRCHIARSFANRNPSFKTPPSPTR